MRHALALVLAGVLGTQTAQAAQTTRTNMNSAADNLVFLDSGAGQPRRQMFMNNLDYLKTVWIAVGGQMFTSSSSVTVKVLDGCGTLVTQASATFDNSGLTSATSWKFVEVPFPTVPLTFNKYYYLQVEMWHPKVVANTDRYVWGRLLDLSGSVQFPEKKRDLMMMVQGTTDDTKTFMPNETSNIACPSRCLLANPSGVENVSWMPRNHFNVIIRSRNDFNGAAKGSFWTDYNTAGYINTLKAEIATMLQGTVSSPGLRETYPFNNYPIAGNPAYGWGSYYPQMNFYIAIEDPAVDGTAATGNLIYRGFQYCANIDAMIDVADGNLPYGGAPGQFFGDVQRVGGPGSTGWGANMRSILVHEVFGHGVATLSDEYIASSSGFSDWRSTSVAASDGWGYQPNRLPISSGCTEWCGGTQPVSWLVSQMSSAGDLHSACWSKTTQSTCENPGGSALCRWIGGLPAIPYWSGYQCIPLNAAKYNIGTSCSAYGNHGCYPLAPRGTSGGAVVDVVQPNGAIMQSWHSPTPAPGFSTVVENTIKDLLDCSFNVSPCASSTQTRCANLFARYGTTGNGYQTFLKFGQACDPGGWIRRR